MCEGRGIAGGGGGERVKGERRNGQFRRWMHIESSTFTRGKTTQNIVCNSFCTVSRVLRKASAARVNRRLRRYYLIVRLLPNVFVLACLPLGSI